MLDSKNDRIESEGLGENASRKMIAYFEKGSRDPI